MKKIIYITLLFFITTNTNANQDPSRLVKYFTAIDIQNTKRFIDTIAFYLPMQDSASLAFIDSLFIQKGFATSNEHKNFFIKTQACAIFLERFKNYESKLVKSNQELKKCYDKISLLKDSIIVKNKNEGKNRSQSFTPGSLSVERMRNELLLKNYYTLPVTEMPKNILYEKNVLNEVIKDFDSKLKELKNLMDINLEQIHTLIDWKTETKKRVDAFYEIYDNKSMEELDTLLEYKP